jgi:hypothetical protein
VELELTGPGGRAEPVSRAFDVAEPQPNITGMSASPAQVGIGQNSRITATENVAGSQATWTWTVFDSGGGNMNGDRKQVAGAPFDYAAWSAPGTYRVQLVVSLNGLTDTRSVNVRVVDNCSLVRVSANPIRLTAGGSANVTVGLRNCPVGREIIIQKAGWLNAPFGTAADPNRNATVQVSLNGSPPSSSNPGAIVFSLENGRSVSFDVSVNTAPTWTGYAQCLGITEGNLTTWFYVDFEDNDTSSLNVTLHVGGFSRRMNITSGSVHGTFWSVQVPKSELPNVQSWSATATDSGRLSDTGSGSRGSCW